MVEVRFVRLEQLKQWVNTNAAWTQLMVHVDPAAIMFPIISHMMIDDGKIVRCRIALNDKGYAISVDILTFIFNRLEVVNTLEVIADQPRFGERKGSVG